MSAAEPEIEELKCNNKIEQNVKVQQYYDFQNINLMPELCLFKKQFNEPFNIFICLGSSIVDLISAYFKQHITNSLDETCPLRISPITLISNFIASLTTE